MLSFSSLQSSWKSFTISIFTDEEMGVQSSLVPCPESHSWEDAEPPFETESGFL